MSAFDPLLTFGGDGTEAPVVSLFSYGTLQQPEVQLGTFGRLLEGRLDAVRDCILVPLTISDPKVVKLSGAEVHSIACRAPGAPDPIPGVVFEISGAELAMADDYEVDVYGRDEVELVSGRRAYMYVGPPSRP